MQDPFVILDRTELFHGDFTSLPGKIFAPQPDNCMQYADNGEKSFSGSLCSLVLGKLVPPGGRNSPPLRLNLRDSVGLNKGDTIAIDAMGPVVTKFQQLTQAPAAPVWPDLESDWEVTLLKLYFPADKVSLLTATQQHEVYSWLCREPLYLVFYQLFQLPRLTHAQYSKAQHDYHPEIGCFTEQQVDYALQIVLGANKRWRHGYTPHLNDIRVDSSPMRAVLVSIFHRTQLSFDPAGWLSWPYPNQVEKRLSQVLATISREGFPVLNMLHTAPPSELMEFVIPGGFRLLRVVSEGISAHGVQIMLAPFYTELTNTGVVTIDCAQCFYLDRIREQIRSQMYVVLQNVHNLPVFALLQLCNSLASEHYLNLMCFQYLADYDSSTTRFLEKLSSPEALYDAGFAQIFPNGVQSLTWTFSRDHDIWYSPDYDPEQRLNSPCLYLKGSFDDNVVVPGLELMHNAISLVCPSELGLAMQFYTRQRRANMVSWKYNFVVATDNDKQRLVSGLLQAIAGTSEPVENSRCFPSRENFVTPCNVRGTNMIVLADGSAETFECTDFQQLECVTIDEFTHTAKYLFYYSSIPITHTILRKLLHHTIKSLVIITEQHNLQFRDISLKS